MQATAVVFSFARRQILPAWGWSGFGEFLGVWFVHWMGLWLFIGLTATVLSSWHEFFLERKMPLNGNAFDYQYYVTMTVLLASIVVYIFAILPPGTFGSGDE